MIKSGDKIVLKNEMGAFKNIGEICNVESVDNGIITFKFGNGLHLGCMSEDELDKYFDVVTTPNNDRYDVEEILDDSEIKVTTIFEKCTVVAVRLPNGFVMVEASACVDPNDYDEKLGTEICMKRIKDKIEELEAYHYVQSKNGNCPNNISIDW